MNKILIVFLILAIVLIGFISINKFITGSFIKTPVKDNVNNNFNKDLSTKDVSTLTLKVNIPCSGHAGLIKSELKKLDGVENVNFRNPNLFDVYYDSNKLTKEKIIALDIFQEYRAQIQQ